MLVKEELWGKASLGLLLKSGPPFLSGEASEVDTGLLGVGGFFGGEKGVGSTICTVSLLELPALSLVAAAAAAVSTSSRGDATVSWSSSSLGLLFSTLISYLAAFSPLGFPPSEAGKVMLLARDCTNPSRSLPPPPPSTSDAECFLPPPVPAPNPKKDLLWVTTATSPPSSPLPGGSAAASDSLLCCCEATVVAVSTLGRRAWVGLEPPLWPLTWAESGPDISIRLFFSAASGESAPRCVSWVFSTSRRRSPLFLR